VADDLAGRILFLAIGVLAGIAMQRPEKCRRACCLPGKSRLVSKGAFAENAVERGADLKAGDKITIAEKRA
jgi:hypothetical protein